MFSGYLYAPDTTLREYHGNASAAAARAEAAGYLMFQRARPPAPAAVTTTAIVQRIAIPYRRFMDFCPFCIGCDLCYPGNSPPLPTLSIDNEYSYASRSS